MKPRPKPTRDLATDVLADLEYTDSVDHPADGDDPTTDPDALMARIFRK